MLTVELWIARPASHGRRKSDGMNLHQRLRTPARWRTAPIPDGYGTRPYEGLTGPVVLPLALDWSTSGVVRDLDDPVDRRVVYEIVLTVGTAADVEKYVDPILLIELWPTLTKPGAVIEMWEPWIAEHQNLWP